MAKEDNSLYCVHCKKKFKNWFAIVGHLQHCRERLCVRRFEIQNYRFILFMNPLHRLVNALQAVQKEYPDSPKIFLGSVSFLKHANYIKEFKIEDISKDKPG